MGIFGSKSDKKKISQLEQENKQNRKRIKQLENLCEEKDSFFMELMADGLRHGSSLAANICLTGKNTNRASNKSKAVTPQGGCF